MPPRRRRKARYDPDVIKTEPDRRRATGTAKDDEIEDEEETVVPRKRTWIARATMMYERSKLWRTSLAPEEAFPFLKLPAEIRNMIYRYIVVSKAPTPIRLDDTKYFHSGGIQTAILSTNRQVFNEASQIMYDENFCVIRYERWQSQGPAVRVDDQQSKTMTARALRSGRNIDMVKHKGLIYMKVLNRLRHVELLVDVFGREGFCDHLTLYFAGCLRRNLVSLNEILILRWSLNKDHPKPHGRDWKLHIKTNGLIGLGLLETVLGPVLDSQCALAVADGNLTVRLSGDFPRGWTNMMDDYFPNLLETPGFSTKKFKELKHNDMDIDPLDLWRYFGYSW